MSAAINGSANQHVVANVEDVVRNAEHANRHAHGGRDAQLVCALFRQPRVALRQNCAAAGRNGESRQTHHARRSFGRARQQHSKLQPQQYVTSGSEIPFCDDTEFINKLLKHLDPYPLSRMYYNAANSMFYTTMENYAVANCKFNIEDYNKIFKGAESVKRLANKTAEDRDELDIYLGTSAKRKNNIR